MFTKLAHSSSCNLLQNDDDDGDDDDDLKLTTPFKGDTDNLESKRHRP